MDGSPGGLAPYFIFRPSIGNANNVSKISQPYKLLGQQELNMGTAWGLHGAVAKPPANVYRLYAHAVHDV